MTTVNWENLALIKTFFQIMDSLKLNSQAMFVHN